MKVAIIYQLYGVDVTLHIVDNVTDDELKVLDKANMTTLNCDNSVIETEMVLAAIENHPFDNVGDWNQKWKDSKVAFGADLSDVSRVYLVSWY